MNIYIDIITCEDHRGKRIAYCPQVHWTLDDNDTWDRETMDKLKQELQDVLDKSLTKIPDQIKREQNKNFCEEIFCRDAMERMNEN